MKTISLISLMVSIVCILADILYLVCSFAGVVAPAFVSYALLAQCVLPVILAGTAILES